VDPTIYTVGHSTRTGDDFVALLRAHEIEVLADVRRFPGSRRHPHFGKDALRLTLADAGIEYVHLVELGGRRGAPKPDSPNGAWRVEAFRAYADAMVEPEWVEALARLEERARSQHVALMCAEAVPWRCHRRLISDALVARGWAVRHILSETRADPHTLNESARVLPDGRIIYPAPEDEQGWLL
jgi:uncharacterized protein (DUF488 family)